VLARAVAWRLASLGRRKPIAAPRRILIAHHLLLGDTLMLTPLLAKLRERFPEAEIVMTVASGIAPLYATRPYGVRVTAYNPHDSATLRPLFSEAGFDIAIVPGDNRYSWLAAALHSRWTVAFAGDRPAYKSWPIDELRPYPGSPGTWGDMVAALIDGPAPAPYDPTAWPAPPYRPFETPPRRFAVLHAGVSTPLRRWEPAKWRALAASLARSGLEVVWSAGRGEEGVVAAIDPEERFRSYAGELDLPQLWHLIKSARLLVCPDTGVSYLGRLMNTPTVTLYGPGSAVLFGAGDFWRMSPTRAVTIADFPCRDQHILFKREIEWVRRCGRTTAECAAPRCMEAIDVASVRHAIGELLGAY
jgi:ADP-heptose:LPS heptosyltransferase